MQACTFGDEQGLADGVGVPGGAGLGGEADGADPDPGGIFAEGDGVDADSPVNQAAGPLPVGCLGWIDTGSQWG